MRQYSDEIWAAYDKMEKPPRRTIQEIAEYLEEKFHPMVCQERWPIALSNWRSNSDPDDYLYKAYEFIPDQLMALYEKEEQEVYEQNMKDNLKGLEKIKGYQGSIDTTDLIAKQLKLIEGGCVLGLLTEDGQYMSRFKLSNHLPDIVACTIYFMMGYKIDNQRLKNMLNGRYIQYLIDIGYLKI